MTLHPQQSDFTRVFFALDVAWDGTTLTIPAGTVWAGGVAYPLSALTHVPAAGPFFIALEAVPGGIDYLVSVFQEETRDLGTPLAEGLGVPKIVWRDAAGELHVLRSVQ